MKEHEKMKGMRNQEGGDSWITSEMKEVEEKRK